MLKKTIMICSSALLFTNVVPVVSFAEQFEKEESTIKESETTDTTSEQEYSTDESTSTLEETTGETTSSKSETIESISRVEQTVRSEKEPKIETEEAPATVDIPPIIDYSSIYFDKNTTTEEFVTKVGEQARQVGKEQDLFASVMIAQAILESGSGSSELAQEPNNNLFGIKGDYEGHFIVYGTWEDDGQGNAYNTNGSFRVYPSVKESFEDYSKLLKEGLDDSPMFYRGTWKSIAENYENATQALTGKYATDTQYDKKLNGLIETYNLTQYDHEKPEIFASDSDFEPYNNVNYDKGNSYAWGNCTQYVYNRITQLGGYIDLSMGNGQDWGKTGKSKGYEVTNTPKAGVAVSFNASVLGADATYGHVAFVEKIYSDGSILISEMNAKGLNVVSTRTIQAEYVGMLTYISPM